METPSNGNQQYIMGSQFGNGVNPAAQGFTPPPGGAPGQMMNGPPGGFPQGNPQAEQQRRMYEQNIRKLQAQNMNHMSPQQQQQQQQRHPMGNINHVVGVQNNMLLQQRQQRQIQMQQHIQQWQKQDGAARFAQHVGNFMQTRGAQFNPVPIITGRQVHSVSIYMNVMKNGGSQHLSRTGAWPKLAASIGINPQQFPSSGQELEHYWRVNLAQFEHTVFHGITQNVQQHQHQHQQRMAAGQPPDPQSMHDESAQSQQPHLASRLPPGHPQGQGPNPLMRGRHPSGANFQTPVKPGMMPQDIRQAQVNGFRPGQEPAPGQQMTGTPVQGQFPPSHPQQSFPGATPTLSKPSAAPAGPPASASQVKAQAIKKEEPIATKSQPTPIGQVFEPTAWHLVPEDEKTDKQAETHGGLPVLHSPLLNVATNLNNARPDSMGYGDLGHVDIRALTMSLKSGIHAEVRVALDTLVLISFMTIHPNPALPLQHCGDLLEAVIDCAEENVDFLADNSPEVSDVMLITSYEDVVRGCHNETKTLQEIQEFGTIDYELDRAAERVTCISNLLRIWSDTEANDKLLCDATVIKFVTTVIRYLGTRSMLLRNHRNTLDFKKDILVFLSNNGDKIDLPGKEEALCILHFLLSFAPSPPPTSADNDEIMFSPYHPGLHRYLPLAVDGLAKILARGDPNRAFYKTIFAQDNASSPSCDLLTRAFGLAIAPLPVPNKLLPSQIDTRIAFLAQGLLAAEIIVSLIPGNEHELPRAWLTSQDGFAQTLFRLVTLFSMNYAVQPAHPQRHQAKQAFEPDPKGYQMITNRGITILRRLAERSKDSDKPSEGIPDNVLPKQSLLVEVLGSTHVDSGIVRHLCSYAGLEA